MKQIDLPLSHEVAAGLKAGEEVALSGLVYATRDVAHARLVELIRKGEPLPIDLERATIFYAGPAPAPPGKVCGSVGPTTSKRMDAFTPELMKAGVKAMIGKGPRGPEVVEAIVDSGSIYFAATGGAAAYLSSFVVSCDVVAWPELGPEAIWRLEIKGLPVFVAIDSSGRDLFAEGPKRYSKI